MICYFFKKEKAVAVFIVGNVYYVFCKTCSGAVDKLEV